MPLAIRLVSQGTAIGNKSEPPFSDLVVGVGRAENVVAFERALVSFFVEAADLLGVPKSVAAIYGLFIATPGPLCFADVDERLDISKGSISQGLRVLREVGALIRAHGSDDRREFFVPDLELRKLVIRWLDQRLQAQLEAGHRRLLSLKTVVPGGHADAEILRNRLVQLDNWHIKARKLLPIAKTYLELTKSRGAS